MDGRKCQKTKVQYRKQFTYFEKWVQLRHSACYNDTAASVSLLPKEKTHLLEFFEVVCKLKDQPGNFVAKHSRIFLATRALFGIILLDSMLTSQQILNSEGIFSADTRGRLLP